MREGTNAVDGSFSIAIESDPSKIRREPSFQPDQQGAKFNRAVQVSHVCGHRAIILAFKTEQIMGDLVCKVDVALNSEVTEYPEVFSAEETMLGIATQSDHIQIEGSFEK
jgi:hypothetical protein